MRLVTTQLAAVRRGIGSTGYILQGAYTFYTAPEYIGHEIQRRHREDPALRFTLAVEGHRTVIEWGTA